jgi:TonB family protein
VLASDEEGGTLDALRFSLASEIVELVVLTADNAFLQTLREAVGAARRLWHVPSADKVSDLLVAGEVGILVLDVQALQEAATVFIAQIKRQFPDLVILVAGNRDAEISLTGLISAGTVYRFIHKPMSPGRAKLFADAAVNKYDAQRRRTASTTALSRRPRSGRGLLIGGAIGFLALTLLVAWAVRRGTERKADAPPVAAPGASTPGASTPGASTPGVTPLADVQERLLARAENALLEERLDEVALAIEAARKAGVESGHIAFLTAQLAKSRQRTLAAQAAAHMREVKPEVDKTTEAPKEVAAPAKIETAEASLAAAPRQDPLIEPAGDITSQEATPARHGQDPSESRQQSVDNVAAAGDLKPIKSVKPEYPKKAELAKVEGWVELDFTVAESGEVRDIAVHAASTPGVFESAATGALSQWRYEPIVRDGKPVAQRARIRMRFAL